MIKTINPSQRRPKLRYVPPECGISHPHTSFSDSVSINGSWISFLLQKYGFILIKTSF